MSDATYPDIVLEVDYFDLNMYQKESHNTYRYYDIAHT